MRDYVDTIQDDGGVHINSGIPNHAFYLLATHLSGYAWEEAGLIWYATLQSPRLRPNVQFKKFASLTIETAADLFPGPNSPEAAAVRDAWGAVGVYP
jgi:Zn-dependent metalloprotease